MTYKIIDTISQDNILLFLNKEDLKKYYKNGLLNCYIDGDKIIIILLKQEAQIYRINHDLEYLGEDANAEVELHFNIQLHSLFTIFVPKYIRNKEEQLKPLIEKLQNQYQAKEVNIFENK